nr:DEAD/DEAH box helicase [Kurthia massiliensis]
MTSLSKEQELSNALHTGFINHQYISPHELQPKLISNDQQQQVLPTILQELRHCHHFKISVAFITTGGLTMLKAVLADLHTKGISGQLLTSTYLSFNHPRVFEQLLKVPNLDVRVTNEAGFHAKGYIFDRGSYETLIVGSSNLTDAALKTNYEWNVKLSSLSNGALLQRFNEQFDHAFQKASPLTTAWIDEYQQHYAQIPQQKIIPFTQYPPQVAEPTMASSYITPNAMQRKALTQIQQVRESGEKRALVISATGTGKTYLSAFDVLQMKPKKMLFIVHREQILKKAMQDYQQILGGPDEDYGLYVGHTRQQSAKYVFATIQTLAKEQHLTQFAKDAFDYVLIDEVHRAGATSYQRVIDYFTPTFMLGMTATPERTDDFNVFELFDYNIAYEIRLQEALAEDMLCPFHYFGVSDFETIHDQTSDELSIDQLVLDDRITHILEKIDYYGHSGSTVKGLMFCSRADEAYALSDKLNARGLRTAALTGKDDMAVREQTVEQLERGELDYIITVDVFNEGIDIPMVNQIVMLRQTQSSIIFIQQLGRGLRKHASKEYVVILDFIGNYKNNYMIPMALSGDNSYNKDNLRRDTLETAYIQGVSSVHFEEIAQQRIFDAINQKTLITLATIKSRYTALKNRLNRVPQLMDFIEHNSIAPTVILEKKATYDTFLEAVEKSYTALTGDAHQILLFVSQELMNGKRRHELILIDLLLAEPCVLKSQFLALLQQEGLPTDAQTIASVENMLTLQFFVSQRFEKYRGGAVIEVEEDAYVRTVAFDAALQQPQFVAHLQDVLACANHYAKRYDAPLVIGEKYGRRDYCRLMNWSKDMTSTIYGYKIDEATHSCPLFITYEKDESLAAETLYEDELLDPKTLKWYTRPRNTLTSSDVLKILHGNLRIDIFIKKEDAEGTDFFYLGTATPIVESAVEEQLPYKDGKASFVSLHFSLDTAIDEAIYRYLTE